MSHREHARAAGYIDGLKGTPCKRLIYHPDSRFAYDAGRRDGEACRTT